MLCIHAMHKSETLPKLDSKCYKIFVLSLVISMIDYCNSLYLGLRQTSINKLQKLQNWAAGIITGKNKFDHITSILKSLHWLPVRKWIEFKVCVIVYKALSGTSPQYISDMLTGYQPQRSLRSSNHHLMQKPSYNQKTYGL